MQSINLNMIPGGVMPVINLTQFDEGRDFAMVILNGAQAADLTGATLLISGRKNDDTAFSYGQSDTVKGNYVISVNNNTVTIRNTLQMAAASGEVIATLTIKKSAADVSTLNFRIMVQEHPLDGVDISNTEIPAIIALAQEQADEAEAWATGEIDGVPVPPTAPQHDNSAEYWAGQAQQAAQGGLHFSGSCTFAQIPTTGMEVGDMWDITDAFTTDNRFREGSGVQCKAGTNIAWDGTYWDLLATGSPKALPAGGITGQILVKQSATDNDAGWGSGIYHFTTVAAAQAAIAGGQVQNGATVLVDEIGGGNLTAPSMAGLSDVQLATLVDGQMLVYDVSAGKWKNKNIDSAISTSSANPVRNSTIAAALANGRISFGVNAGGEWGYKKDGADTVYPFALGKDISYIENPPVVPPPDKPIRYGQDRVGDYGNLHFGHFSATIGRDMSASSGTFGIGLEVFDGVYIIGVGVATPLNSIAKAHPAFVKAGECNGYLWDGTVTYYSNKPGVWLVDTEEYTGEMQQRFWEGAAYDIQYAYITTTY